MVRPTTKKFRINMTISIEKEIKDSFLRICQTQGLIASREIEKYMMAYNNAVKKQVNTDD